MGLDLHKLEHLIAVVEEGSFTRAATRVHLSQQALSTSIRALEREVGVDLLDRSGGTITLLPGGRALVDDAKVLRGAASSALQRARRLGRGEPEVLRIGHTPAVTGDEVLGLLRRVRAAHPEVAPEVNQRYPSELTHQLLAADLDVGLCRAMRPPHGLTRSTLSHDRLRIAVDADHRLAARDNVHITELAAETIMVWGHPGTSDYTDLLIAHCREAGFEPRVQRNPIQGTPPITAVLNSEHPAFVTEVPGLTAGGQVRVLELEPALSVPLHAVWSAYTTSAARDAFLSAAIS